MQYWVEDKGCYFTPGGDPLWRCPRCGNGEHVYGIESPIKENKCKDCGLEVRYPHETNEFVVETTKYQTCEMFTEKQDITTEK